MKLEREFADAERELAKLSEGTASTWRVGFQALAEAALNLNAQSSSAMIAARA